MTDSHFANHVMRREAGCTWRCARPGTFTYGFRVTWAPGALMISGDIGDLIVRHYSFSDPWAAAAWVNGAEWDYFMEKAAAEKEYERDETAEFIVERAYQQMRDGWRGGLDMMERIVDRFGLTFAIGDHNTVAGRKYACREMLASGVDEHVAYDITDDPESLICRYPHRYRVMYEAARWWAAAMWESEPIWHMALRLGRRARAEWRDLRRWPILFAPVRYARFDSRGRPISFNGATYWRWLRNGQHRRYEGLRPLVVLGHDMTRFGLWRVQGSSWPDTAIADHFGRPTIASEFQDVRPQVPA